MAVDVKRGRCVTYVVAWRVVFRGRRQALRPGVPVARPLLFAVVAPSGAVDDLDPLPRVFAVIVFAGRVLPPLPSIRKTFKEKGLGQLRDGLLRVVVV